MCGHSNSRFFYEEVDSRRVLKRVIVAENKSRREAKLQFLADPASLKEFVANKRCGGFHPDWCLEWRTGEEIVRCQICFGCRQVKFYNAKTILFADLTDAAIEQIEPALVKYQKQRPAHLRGQQEYPSATQLNSGSRFVA